VVFNAVDVVRAQTDGMWISGLPDSARIITVGQGFVQAGDNVRVSERKIDSGLSELGAAGDVRPDGSVPDDICERDPADTSTRLVAGTREGPAVQEPDAAAAPETPEPETPEPEAAPEPEANGADADQPQQQAALGSDDAVAAVQWTLIDLGFDAGPVDGVMGEQTRDALSLYQEQNDLPATGELDRASFDRLMRTDAADSGARSGARSGERS
jgi:hypothetical protein